ncbi:MAG: hypothetical protein H0W89_05135 [Candidatus Levybacteria bacterium]|nr:hypothetical protein [Candidatus Levybacteria bacterium]
MATETGGIPQSDKQQDKPTVIDAQIIDPPSGASLDTSGSEQHRVTVIPKNTLPVGEPTRGGTVDRDRLGIYTGLAASGRRGFSARVSLIGDGEEHKLIVEGGGFVANGQGDDINGEKTLITPAGAKAVPYPVAEGEADNERFGFWKRITGEPGRWMEDDQEPWVAHPGIPVEDAIVASQAGRPYAIVADAEPIKPEEIKRLAAEVGKQIIAAKAREEEPGQEEKAQLLKERHGEISKGVKTGFWKVRPAVGAATEADVEELAMKYEMAAYAPQLKYTLGVAERTYPTLEDALADASVPPIVGSTELVSHLVPIPRGDHQLQGVAVRERPRANTNPENQDKIPPERAVPFGRVIDDYDHAGKVFNLDADRQTEQLIFAGRSGIGKTVAIENWVEAMIRNDAERARQESQEATQEGHTDTKTPERRPMGALLITPKAGNDFKTLGERLAAEGRDVIFVSFDDADAVPVGIDPARRMPGESPKQADARLITGVVSSQAASGNHDPEVGRTIEQYGGEGAKGSQFGGKTIASLHEKAGMDPNLGISKYAGGDPAEPTFRDFVDKTIEDVKGHAFTHQAERLPEFVGSWLGMVQQAGVDYLEGYSISPEKMREAITIVNISGVRDPIARSLIVTTLADFTTAIMEHEQNQEGDPNRTKFLLVVDEINEVVKEDTPAEEKMVAITRRIRSTGTAVAFGAQILAEVPGGIISNTGTTVVLEQANPEDIAVAAGKLGITDQEMGTLGKLKRGVAYIKSPDAGDAVRVAWPDRPAREAGTPFKLKGPKALIDDNGQELYTLREKYEAKAFIDNTTPGTVTRLWADLEVVIEALGMDTAKPDDAFLQQNEALDFFDKIRERTGGDRRVFDLALRTVVTQAVDERAKYFLEEKSRDKVIDKVTRRLTHHLVHPDKPLPVELTPGPALKVLEPITSKGNTHAFINHGERFADARKQCGDEIRRVETAVANGHMEMTDAVSDYLRSQRTKAAEFDEHLIQYPMFTYDAATGEIINHRDHPAYAKLDASKLPIGVSLSDLLIPPNAGGYTIDKGIGITIDDAVAGGQRDAWLSTFEGILNYFDLPAKTRELLFGEYRGILDTYIAKGQAKLDAANVPNPTIQALDAVVNKLTTGISGGTVFHAKQPQPSTEISEEDRRGYL